jgi:hypothetical protein
MDMTAGAAHLFDVLHAGRDEMIGALLVAMVICAFVAVEAIRSR